MFLSRWLTRIGRRYIAPIPEDVSRKWALRTSFIYMAVMMYVCGIVYGRIERRKKEQIEKGVYREESPAVKYARLYNVKDINVYKIRNFSVVDSYQLKDYEAVKSDGENATLDTSEADT